MASIRKLVFLLFVFFLLSHSSIQAQLHQIQTNDLRLLYYDGGHTYTAPHVVRCFENALRFHQRLFQYYPSEEITVLIEDFGDFGNAGATATPRNAIIMGISPFHYAYETILANERMNWLMNHELVHIVALDQAAPSDRFYRNLFFGKVSPVNEHPVSILYGYLTTPRRYSPRWYHEGIAVFLETWMAGGMGRALGAYDEMVFRTFVRDDKHIYDAVGLESEGTTVDFQVGAISYLYGTRFMSYLAYHYGPEKLIEWVSRTDGTRRYYASQFRNVFGNSLDNEWSAWISWERTFQESNLENIRKNPVTTDRPISRRALGSVSRGFYNPDEGEIYVAISYPGQVAHIAAIDVETGSMRRIVDVRGAALYFVSSLAYDHNGGTIFFTTANNSWRDLNAVDIHTGRSQRLIKDVRTGDLAFNPDDRSLWGVRHFNGISSLVRIPHPYTEWNRIHSLPYGEDIFDIDISPDGKFLTAAIADLGGNQKLVRMETDSLLAGNWRPEELVDFEVSSPASFIFSADGRYLFGSSYYSGVSNIVRYDFESGQMNWITNAETGYFRPIPFNEDSLFAFRFTGDGFVPVKIANQRQEYVSAIRFLGQKVVEEHPIVRDWMVPSPSPRTIDIDTLITYRGDFYPGRHIRLNSAYPIVEGYKNYVSYGMKFNFADPVLFNQIHMSFSFSPYTHLPLEERFHASVGYEYQRWKFSANYNAASFYDLFGPTKTSRKGYSFGINYGRSLIYDSPRLMNFNIFAAYYGGMERLPQYQNIISSFSEFFSVGGQLSYQHLLSSLGAVDWEKGYRMQLNAHTNYVQRTVFPRVWGNVDYGISLPINHSSIWFRSSAGYSFGKREEPLANFYFGGFGNNWIDYLSSRRYREYYSFPGAELNAIGGTNYGKLLVEWTLPPIRFRRLGFVSVYSNWSQLTLFASGIMTNIDSATFRREVYNVGTQVDLKLVIISMLESTLSFGYAMAFEETGNPKNEFMISLKILR